LNPKSKNEYLELEVENLKYHVIGLDRWSLDFVGWKLNLEEKQKVWQENKNESLMLTC